MTNQEGVVLRIGISFGDGALFELYVNFLASVWVCLVYGTPPLPPSPSPPPRKKVVVLLVFPLTYQQNKVPSKKRQPYVSTIYPTWPERLYARRFSRASGCPCKYWIPLRAMEPNLSKQDFGAKTLAELRCLGTRQQTSLLQTEATSVAWSYDSS